MSNTLTNNVFKIKEDLYYTGVIDKDLEVFDIIMETEFSTNDNSYLIKNENKYSELKNKKKLFNINISLNKLDKYRQISKIGICLGTILVGITISMISVQVLFLAGMGTLLISGVGMLVINDIGKEVEENNFVDSYLL